MKTALLQKLFRSLLLLSCLCLGSGYAAAAPCGGSLPYNLEFYQVEVPESLKPGQALPYASRDYSIKFECERNTPEYQTAKYKDIVGCFTSSGTKEVQPGIYSTRTPGIGVRIRNSSGALLTGAVGKNCMTKVATTNGLTIALAKGNWELVRLDGALPLPTTLTQADLQMTFMLADTRSIYYGTVAGSNFLFPRAEIVKYHNTCSVSFPTQVTMADVKASVFGNVGSMVLGSAFKIGTKCTQSANVGLTLDAAPAYPVINKDSGTIAMMTGNGVVAGVALRITEPDTGRSIPLGKRLDQGSISAGQMAEYPFWAFYVRMGAVTAGSLSSGMVFTFDYK